MNDQPFVYVTYIASTCEAVWNAFLDSRLSRQYWQHEQVCDWQPGASWSLVADDAQRTVKHVGRVLEFRPPHRLAVTWADPSPAARTQQHSRLAVDVEAAGEMVRLTVTHDQLSPEMRRKITYGWPLVLSSLKSFVETGRALDIFA